MKGIMKHLLLVIYIVAFSTTIMAQKKVSWRFMPQWTPQAQFTGYYVAYQKGFYAQEGIDLTIEHVTAHSTNTPFEKLIKGDVDIIVQKLQQTVMYRSNGYKVLNILQTSQNSGLMCVSCAPIPSPQSLSGLKVGQWKTGHSELCQMMEHENQITDIEWISFLQSMNLLIAGAIDATLCYSYNEYISLIFSLGNIPEENILHFSDIGYNFPEDAICVTEKFYQANQAMLERFNAATIRGWNYANDHPEEALDIVMEYVERENVATNRYHQKLMMEEVLRLQKNPNTNQRDYAPMDSILYQEMVERMLKCGLLKKSVKYEEVIR